MSESLFLLLVAHALADFPLQGDFLSKAKNHLAPIPGVQWWQAMAAHCLIHAGAVWLILRSPTFAAMEFVAHFIIDHQKCAGRITFGGDQLLHIAYKVAYVLIAWWIQP